MRGTLLRFFIVEMEKNCILISHSANEPFRRWKILTEYPYCRQTYFLEETSQKTRHGGTRHWNIPKHRQCGIEDLQLERQGHCTVYTSEIGKTGGARSRSLRTVALQWPREPWTPDWRPPAHKLPSTCTRLISTQYSQHSISAYEQHHYHSTKTSFFLQKNLF